MKMRMKMKVTIFKLLSLYRLIKKEDDIMVKYVKIQEKAGNDLDIKEMPMYAIVFVKHEEQTDDKVYSFYNPSGECLKFGTKVAVDTAMGVKNAKVIGSFLVPKSQVGNYMMAHTRNRQLKRVVGVYKSVKVDVLESTTKGSTNE